MSLLVTPWTRDEERDALRMRSEGRPLTEIAAYLGRSYAAIVTKLWHLENPDGRKRRQLGGAPRRHAFVASDIEETPSGRPTAQMLADRDKRLVAKRTITASLMGDPAPGQSALDRREP